MTVIASPKTREDSKKEPHSLAKILVEKWTPVKHPNHYALVIGINDYAEQSRQLKGAINDAQAFIDWLTNYQEGGLKRAHCLDLLSKPEPQLSPDQGDIDDKIEELCNLVLKNNPNGEQAQRLYFYFSGHGTGISPANVGLCYSKWSTTKNAALLSSNDYLTYLQNTGYFGEIIVILDCCRSWEGVPGSPPTLSAVRPDAERTPNVKTLTLFGSEFMARSIEATDPTTQDVRGFFTSALIEGLKGKAALPATGEVTLEHLQNYLEREMPRRSNNGQKPRFRNDNLKGDFVLHAGAKDLISYQYDESAPAKLDIQYQPGIAAEVTVYTVFNEIRHRGTGPAVLWLSKGTYYIVANYIQFSDSYKIELLNNTTYLIDGVPHENTTTRDPLTPVLPTKLQPPKSAALIEGTPGTHETFSHPAEKASLNPTHAITDETGARLLVYIRHAHPTPDSSMAKNLALTDMTGLVRSVFADNELFIEDPNDPDRYKRDGYIALSVEAKPGLYFLTYFGDKPRQLLIRLYARRQTVVFILYDNQPLFDTTRIFLPSIQDGYRIYDSDQRQENADLDTAIALFQNNQSFISPGIVERLLEAKFRNPMMGIIGAYLLLRGRMNQEGWYRDFLKLAQDRHSWHERRYFEIIIGNLENLLGKQDPDIKTIRLLASDFLIRYRDEPFVFDEPPMIDWGLRQVINQSSLHPSLITGQSQIMAVASKLYGDSVYSSWSHTQTFEAIMSPQEAIRGIGLPAVDNWVKIAVCGQLIQYIKRAQKKDAPILAEQSPTAQSIARSVGLPIPIIDQTIQELSQPDNWWWDDPEVPNQLDITARQMETLRTLLNAKVI